MKKSIVYLSLALLSLNIVASTFSFAEGTKYKSLTELKEIESCKKCSLAELCKKCPKPSACRSCK